MIQTTMLPSGKIVVGGHTLKFSLSRYMGTLQCTDAGYCYEFYLGVCYLFYKLQSRVSKCDCQYWIVASLWELCSSQCWESYAILKAEIQAIPEVDSKRDSE